MISTTGRMPVMAAPTPMPADAGFGDRRIDHALCAEFFDQARKHFERRARLGDIFADDENRRIAAHLFGQGFVDRLGEGDLARGCVTAMLSADFAFHVNVTEGQPFCIPDLSSIHNRESQIENLL